MPNPLFNAMRGGQNQPQNMMQQFSRFVREMNGKDPNQMINQLVSSGKVSQQQLNQAQNMAQQMSGMFAPFFNK